MNVCTVHVICIHVTCTCITVYLLSFFHNTIVMIITVINRITSAIIVKAVVILLFDRVFVEEFVGGGSVDEGTLDSSLE